jgi:hypothetical protein
MTMTSLCGVRRLLKWAALGLLLVTGWPAIAQAPIPGYPTDTYAFDPREVAMIPRYCIYTQMFRASVPGGNNDQAIGSWSSFMGPTFIHMHHYCAALMKMNRAKLLAKDTNTRRFYLSDAILEIDYVVTKAPNDFILMPEMLTKKAECQILLGQAPLGAYSLERAIEVKKDYWPAYAQLSDLYKSLGETAKAREALETGLVHSPDASALTRRLAELDTPSNARTQR